MKFENRRVPLKKLQSTRSFNLHDGFSENLVRFQKSHTHTSPTYFIEISEKADEHSLSIGHDLNEPYVPHTVHVAVTP